MMLQIPESLGGVWSPSLHRSGSVPRRPDLPSRGVDHTTETRPGSWQGVRATLQYPYHALIEIQQRKAYQLVDLNLTASSLEAGDGFETNHAGRHCIQFSFVMYAQDTPDLLTGDLQYLADLHGWVNEQTGIKNKWAKTMGPNQGVVLASESSPIRMSPTEWYAWDGWCGHQHVPSNSHWDCGALDVETIHDLIAAKEIPDVDPMLIRDGFKRYGKDAAATEFVRSSLALLGFNPGPQGQRLDEAILKFKSRHMDAAKDPKPTVGPGFWKRLVAEVALIETREPAIVEVPDPAMAAKVANLEDKLARIRAVVN